MKKLNIILIKLILKSNSMAFKPAPKIKEKFHEKYLQNPKAKCEILEMANGNLEKYSHFFQYKSYYKIIASHKSLLLAALQNLQNFKFHAPLTIAWGKRRHKFQRLVKFSSLVIFSRFSIQNISN